MGFGEFGKAGKPTSGRKSDSDTDLRKQSRLPLTDFSKKAADHSALLKKLSGIQSKINIQDYLQLNQMESNKKTTELATLKRKSLPVIHQESQGIKTVGASIESDLPELVTLRLAFSEQEVRDSLMIMILKSMEYFNVGKGLNRLGVQAVADLLIERYYYLNFADIRLCIKKALAGDYGTIYDRMDANVVLEWFAKYSAERIEMAAMLSERSSRKLQAEANNDHFKALAAQYAGKILAEKKEKEQPNELKISESQRWHGEILGEFDRIHKDQAGQHDLSGVKAILLDGKIYTSGSFLNEVINQTK